MEQKLIQITSGRGPEECGRVVAKLHQLINSCAIKYGIKLEMIGQSEGDLPNTFHSVTLLASATNLQDFTNEWSGTIQWIAQSPFRKLHRRKNWFVGVSFFDCNSAMKWDEREVRFETCRSSGPGGQNVNKVETAVRGIHIPSGIKVLATDSRSQLQNKKLGLERLKSKVLAWHSEQLIAQQQNRWQEHNELERGNPVKVIEATLY